MLKVKNNTNPNKLAGAISGCFREEGAVELQCIGAGAVNQAIKGIIIAKGFLAPTGLELRINPCFESVLFEEGEKTAIKLIVEAKEANRI